MPTQSLVFVVLPNGVTAQKTLRLSLYLTMRLFDGATLADFPDILAWVPMLQKSGIQFQLSCEGVAHTVSADRSVLRPDIWTQLFPSTTYVDPPVFPDFDKRIIVSYPVRDSLAFVKNAYQAVGTDTLPRGEGQRGLYTLLQPLMFRDGQTSTLDQEMANMRVTLHKEQNRSYDVNALGAKDVAPPDGAPSGTQAPADSRDTLTRFALYHNMPPAPNRPPLPKSEADFAKTLDFHRAITSLCSYPSLLRHLGLVFDVEVPLSFCPASPNGAAYRDIAVNSVTPGFKWKITPQITTPATSYVSSDTSFAAAPTTDPVSLGQKAYVPGDVVDGLLALSPDDFHMLQVDIDGALLKALSMADSVAFSDYRGKDLTKVDDALPALRSSGIGLVADDRGSQILQAISQNKGFYDSAANGGQITRPMNVLDLVRGYRFDIHSSRTNKWHSLHRRNSTYTFGTTNPLQLKESDEEGFLQPSAASPADDPTRPDDPTATAAGIPQPGTDLYIHERIARWDGWSLSAPRPGKHINRSADPSHALDDDPTEGQPMTPFKMQTSFAVMPGSLPQLRFGTQYQLRARAVDLAGNSVGLSVPAAEEFTVPAPGTGFTYQRFDPVPSPLVVLQQKPGPGASLEQLVIRSYNSSPDLDGVATGEVDNRHIAPPRTSVRMAEQHGALDDAAGHLKGDQATYQMLVTRDAFEFPTVGKDSPIESGPTLAVQYLADPLARGAAFRDLPNAPNNTNGTLASGALSYATLPDVQPRAGSVTYIDFGTTWPDRKALRLKLVEGNFAPKWDPASRLLTVSLKKSGSTDVELSSYITPADLGLMGVWGWMREIFEAQEMAVMSGDSWGQRMGATSDAIALLTRLVLEGGHELITPVRTLNLTHAVQQPIGRPEFVQLPVLHQPSQPIMASALRNYFTPITAWRSISSHSAVLLGGLAIHGASTAKVDIQARWQEPVDDTTKPAPGKQWHSQQVEKLELANTNAGPIYFDATHTRMLGVYIPKVDTLWFAAAFDQLDGVDNPGDTAAPVHHFDDTKHRWVTYQPVAVSRFQECFTDQTLDFTRSGEPLVVNVPSSARPNAPDIAYVIPAFGWEKQETTNAKSVIRFGNCLRVYLNRPWYSSGDDELLGAVLWPSGTTPEVNDMEQYKPYFTQWGNDPIWQTGGVGTTPDIYGDFSSAITTASNLQLEETPKLFDVAGHQVFFDAERKLWYCDITFRNNYSYCPFVRLALARYQTHSIQGVELSRVVLADFTQLTPDRSAVVTIDPGNPRTGRIFVGGLAPDGPTQNYVTVTVERRLPTILTDLGWEPVPYPDVTIVPDVATPQPGSVLWSGKVQFPDTPAPGQYRIVIREFEVLPDHTPGAVSSDARLVYASIVPYDYFPLGK